MPFKVIQGHPSIRHRRYTANVQVQVSKVKVTGPNVKLTVYSNVSAAKTQ